AGGVLGEDETEGEQLLGSDAVGDGTAGTVELVNAQSAGRVRRLTTKSGATALTAGVLHHGGLRRVHLVVPLDATAAPTVGDAVRRSSAGGGTVRLRLRSPNSRSCPALVRGGP
ncbi:hypothetical protein, partial [Streptomyces sp.]|uniref:hypothetical protein n=1 Tax=Streptomyces sp. TaxID=1931 RepID=UPI0028125405